VVTRVIAIVLCALGLMAAGAWILRHEPSVARRSGSVSALPQSNDALALAQLRAEVRALRGEVVDAKARSTAGVAEPAAREPEVEPEVAFDAEQAAAARAAALSSRFEAEALDAPWSVDAARTLQAVFAGGVVAGAQLLAAECRATLCRVRLRHDDDSRRRELAPQIAERAPFAGGVHYVYSPDDARDTTLYVSRSGK
jgi:hypothetical protein